MRESPDEPPEEAFAPRSARRARPGGSSAAEKLDTPRSCDTVTGMRVLVTGGAGYIGSHTSLLLSRRGDDVVVVDDLSTGRRERISDLPLIEADLSESSSIAVVAKALADHGIEAVVHFAAKKEVGESVARPAWYYRQNVGGLANLLLAMEAAGTGSLVFSSSAAIYGNSPDPITEDDATLPLSPYGATKLVGEQLIDASCRAGLLAASSLRYFNVAGAEDPTLAEPEAQNLIPMVIDRIRAGRQPEIFGDDYDTPDGTCIRDFVHVSDVAAAHLAVLDSLPSVGTHRVLNVGTGVGTSVRTVVSTILEMSPFDLEPVVADRRPGDAAIAVAAVDRIREDVGWSAQRNLADIVESALRTRSA